MSVRPCHLFLVSNLTFSLLVYLLNPIYMSLPHLLPLTVSDLDVSPLPGSVDLLGDTELFLLPSKINSALSGQRSGYPPSPSPHPSSLLSFLLPLSLLFKISPYPCIFGNFTSPTYFHHFIPSLKFPLTLISCALWFPCGLECSKTNGIIRITHS